ncbi:15170_t:CDS:2 [Rhizophagus irregularis]|uniref:Ixr1p n=3 Tax=Rhizophagus irregularis TaxID=588596 RepID=A0A015M2S9_RHIIW|nr:Ixr1p [Rhizophagus irregularis DAOM 197198w]CAG8678737.1 15170_t:CDS:2 [Rhizophagus irregularis]
MNMLGKLSQSSLATRILGTTPSLYCNGRIVCVNLLRQYATTTTKNTKNTKKNTKNTKTTKTTKSTKTKRGSDSKSTQKKSKKEKENVYLIPQEPKKPSTAYTLFFRDFFYERHKKNPEDKVTEIARLAGNEWVKLSAEEKNKYTNQYKEKRDEFKTSHEAWLRSLTLDQIAQENKRRRMEMSKGRRKSKLKLLKHPDQPKRPKTPYIHFVVERMSDNAEKGAVRIKELASEWRQLSDEDKEPYKKRYQQSKSEYETDMRAFEEKYIVTN